MRKVIFLSAVFFIGCSPAIRQIGRVNMISQRNVDPNMNYEQLASYSGGAKSELKKSKAENIEDAVDQTVRKVPGGEFLTNAKIYEIDGKYFAVEGDVWGMKGNVAHRGFKVGDKVTWKVGAGVFRSGVVKALKDDVNCYVLTDAGDTVEKKYDEISKAE